MFDHWSEKFISSIENRTEDIRDYFYPLKDCGYTAIINRCIVDINGNRIQRKSDAKSANYYTGYSIQINLSGGLRQSNQSTKSTIEFYREVANFLEILNNQFTVTNISHNHISCYFVCIDTSNPVSISFKDGQPVKDINYYTNYITDNFSKISRIEVENGIINVYPTTEKYDIDMLFNIFLKVKKNWVGSSLKKHNDHISIKISDNNVVINPFTFENIKTFNSFNKPLLNEYFK